MPLPRFHKLPPHKQQLIVEAARVEFAAHGFAAASLNRIIKAAGISKGAFYYYFADKGDVYRTVMQAVLDDIAAVLARVAPPDSAATFWQWGYRALSALSDLTADPTLGALARDLYAAPPAAAYAELHARVSRWTERAITHGQRLGAVRDDLPQSLLVAASTGLLVAIDRWFANALAGASMETLAPVADKALQLFRNMLEPPAQDVANKDKQG